ncbi:MAG TPA: MarR family transcriptional regulator [Acidimicrobiales bacterium]|nr:MarR family transcriptional regulator [Acidimicrobiales bacterium]
MATRTPTAKDALAKEVWGQLYNYFQLHRAVVQEHLVEMGLSFGDLRALMVLEPEGPRPMHTLAEAWACDASNATWMVDRLEQRGLVERRMLPADRRVKAVVLTAAGVETKVKLLERLSRPPDDLLALSAADLEAVRDALAKLPKGSRQL